ncbi:hypothetical protein GLOIN_2v1780677 [Rhizophagus irregularis DAOM 181602=DAOM 197198]|nr:hypothetical protein GLOIN_2v1780677 [Rhizophagus irregularis DAOM 181602=DAOM 197198]
MSDSFISFQKIHFTKRQKYSILKTLILKVLTLKNDSGHLFQSPRRQSTAPDIYFEGSGRQRIALDVNFKGPGHQRMALDVYFKGPGCQRMALDFTLKIKEAETEFRAPISKLKEADYKPNFHIEVKGSRK